MFCKDCGAEIKDEKMKFCSSCGKELPAAKTPPQQTAAKMQPEPEPEYDAQKDAADNKVMAVLAYLSFLVFIPLFMGEHKKSPFVNFHTNQGLVLFIFEAILWIVTGVVFGILGSVVWEFLWLWSLLSWLLSLIPLIFAIIGILNAVKGMTKPLPLIGKITIIK